MQYYSQKQQDQWVINEVLPQKKYGFFLDLAAADGITNNNTLILEKHFNWRGICIEPNPKFLKELHVNRQCFIDGSVISNKEENVRFRIDNGQLGGIVAEDTDNSERLRAEQLKHADIILLKATTLLNVLEKYNAPKEIDYFSLDVEGSEERIISTFDFTRYQFNCMTIERPTPNINQILFSNGYIFVKNLMYDSFYIHSSLSGRISCEPFEQVPIKYI